MSENNNENSNSENKNENNFGQEFAEKAKEVINNVEDNTKEFTDDEINSGKLMGIFSYILAPIPYILEKENKFAKYHAAQGMTLFILGIILAVLMSILGLILGSFLGWILSIINGLIGVVYTLLCIIGIVNVIQGKAKKLPLIGDLKIFS